MLPAPLEREWLWSALESLLAKRGEAVLVEAPLVLPTCCEYERAAAAVVSTPKPR